MRPATLPWIRLPSLSVEIMSQALAREGKNFAEICREDGLDLGAVMANRSQISCDEEIAFQRCFVRATPNRPDLWFEVGQAFSLPTYGIYGLAVMAAPTLEYVREIYDKLRDFHYSFVKLHTIDDGALAGIHIDDSDIPEDLREFDLIRILGSTKIAFDALWNGPFPFHHIELALPSGDSELLTRLMGCPVEVGSRRTACHWEASLSEKSLPFRDDLLHQHYLRQCEELLQSLPNMETDIFKRRLESAVADMPIADLNLEAVARLMGMSTRTLQRRLEERQLAFRDVARSMRERKACDLLLRSTMRISDIADLLGYSEVRSFHHAFRQWTGQSPGCYRRAARAAPAGAGDNSQFLSVLPFASLARSLEMRAVA